MKKLLGTTALVAAGFATAPAMAADKINIDVGGYFVGAIAGVFSADFGANEIGETGTQVDERNVRFARESEIHFKGSTTLDNGIEIGVRFELQGGDDQSEPFDNLDEAYIWVSGAFGEFQFGDQDGVGDQMPLVAPSPFLEHFANDTDLDPIGEVFGETINTVLDVSSDFSKIIYFTPRIAGFQVGFSYAPEPRELSGNEEYTEAFKGDDEFENFFEAGLTWEYDWSGIEIGVSGVYVTAVANGTTIIDSDGDESFFFSDDSALVGLPTVDEVAQQNQTFHDWAIGSVVGWGNWTFGGAYSRKQSTVSFSDKTLRTWDVGGTYATGPWTFGVEYAQGKRDEIALSTADPAAPILIPEADDYAIIGGLAYSLGGGADITLGYKYGKNDVNNNDASAVFSELGVKF